MASETMAQTILTDRSFTLFPSLLPELQIMIWKEALPDRRVVYIPHAVGDSPFELYKAFLPMHSTALIPAVLHACSESRRITMAAGWSLEFGRNLRLTPRDGRIWFNFDKDILYLPHRRGLPILETYMFAETDLAKIKNVAIQSEMEMEWAVATFQGMEELLIRMDMAKQPRLEYSKVPRLEGTPKRKYKMSWHRRVLYRVRHLNIYAELKCNEWRRHRRTRKWDRVRDQWTFLDADVSKLTEYCVRKRSILRSFFHIDGIPYPRDHFQSVIGEFEQRIQSWRYPNTQTNLAPKVRIGVVVPESSVQFLMDAREHYWNTEQAIVDVRSPGHIEIVQE